MPYGYAGKILRIDLSTGSVTTEPLSEELTERFIGGRGFVAKTMFDEIPAGIDPFSKDNRFVIASGPLSGHYLPASGKTHFGTKSPATGGYADSNMGGHFGPALKYAGYDMMILTGCAEVPSYLYIDDDRVEIRSADAYWGQGSLTVEKQMKEALGEDFQILTIGPAGENRVRFACISHDFGRQAGRTGVGAVLGSKNIKAIAVRGTGSLPVFDVDAAFAAGKAAFQQIYAKPGFTGWTPEGTAGITDWTNEVGVFPTRNFQTSHSDHYKAINGKEILKQIKITDKGCYCCPTPCGKYGKAVTAMGSAYMEGPEYETIALFGGSCLLPTIHDVAYANYLCDELGLDTISGGVVVSWAIECLEKGILTEEQTGHPLAFGDLETVDYLLRKIAAREGIGDLLAEGVKIASEKIGGGSDRFAIHVKGLEWTGYESRNAPSMMLAYMTADVGAHHNRAWVLGHDVAGSATNVHDLITAGGKGEKLPKAPVTEDCADFVIESQNTRPLFDALGVCRLQFMELGFEPENYEKLFYVITGKMISWQEMLKVSERIWQLTRAFSAREIAQFGRHLDFPPPRFYTEPVPSGPNAGHHVTREEVDMLLDWYYQKRGWTQQGIPARETLEAAGLPEIAEALEAAGLYS
ncbi:MAG: aldehyde ferredoxin oxidoreductase family protein [Thermodesulfobacteriota bacterium]